VYILEVLLNTEKLFKSTKKSINHQRMSAP